jgi:D-3-phosphoglycerate dehydrogenase
MRVLIADAFETSGRDGLAALGCDVVYEPKLKDQSLVDAIRDQKPDVLIVRSTQVTEAALTAGPLKLVVRAGAGYNTIDVAAASNRGIYVSNCPGKNSVAVAELAFGLILALDRRIADNVISLRAGKWNKTEFSKAKGLYGRTLGIVGTGQIAQELITRAKAFGMPVIAWSRSLTAERAEELGIERCETPLEVAARADVVSIHLALAKETRGMIGAEFLMAMRPNRPAASPTLMTRSLKSQPCTARITLALRPNKLKKRSPPRRCESFRTFSKSAACRMQLISLVARRRQRCWSFDIATVPEF